MTYYQFIARITDDMNERAIMTGDLLIQASEVATMPEAFIAYEATLAMAQVVKG